MGRFVQLVMGPAGVGKSTYCKVLQDHCKALKRTLHVANLDPAAENFDYEAAFDVRDLISLEDAMDEFGYGPNGGLVYCMEYLLQNCDWLQDELENFGEDDYVLLDCPGQVELYSHLPIMHNLVVQLKMWGFQVVSVYLLDALYVVEIPKFISGCLLSLSSMLQLELPHINVVTKCDLINKSDIEAIINTESLSVLQRLREYQKQDQIAISKSSVTSSLSSSLIATSNDKTDDNNSDETVNTKNDFFLPTGRYSKLTHAIGTVVDDYMMVSFLLLDPKDEESIEEILHVTDHAVQYGEDTEPKESVYEQAGEMLDRYNDEENHDDEMIGDGIVGSRYSDDDNENI